jgi:hypothetical protein
LILFKKTVLLLLWLWPLLSPAQRLSRSRFWEEKAGTWLLGVDIGTTRYMGDLSENLNWAHLQLGATAGVSLAHRLSDRFTARAEIRAVFMHAQHRFTKIAYNNLSFAAVNPDGWLGLQYDLIHIDVPREDIPYLFGGVGLTYMTPFTRYRGQYVDLPPLQTEGVAYNRLAGLMRYGAGWLIYSGNRTGFCLELSYTHVMSDYLDDVSNRYPTLWPTDPLASALTDRAREAGYKPNVSGNQRGNPEANDGYFLLTIRGNYTLSTYKGRRRR